MALNNLQQISPPGDPAAWFFPENCQNLMLLERKRCYVGECCNIGIFGPDQIVSVIRFVACQTLFLFFWNDEVLCYEGCLRLPHLLVAYRDFRRLAVASSFQSMFCIIKIKILPAGFPWDVIAHVWGSSLKSVWFSADFR